ncbi:MAG: hypothetical protein K2N78_11275 [Oscillospiraceae bacterium]|nr:hypothetical protein [Oscillospiraceae bacterium]
MKKSKYLLTAFLALLLTGCSLARAEADTQAGDRWVGFYVVPTQGGRSIFYNNPYVEEYGSSTVNVEGMGHFELSEEVLFAVEDEAGNRTFPGIDVGFSLYYVEETRDGAPCTTIVSNMGAHDDGAGIVYKDEGSSITLSGTVYCGPPLDTAGWDPYGDGTIWEFLRVYQTKDGRVYINGDGDSTNGPMTHSRTETRTGTWNGETTREETLSVKVAVETVPRMERLVVTQFDKNNAVLQSEDLSLQNDRPAVRCQPETAWILVEEIGSDGTERAVYSVPEGEEPVSHDYVLLDDDGYGYLAYLNIYGDLPDYSA